MDSIIIGETQGTAAFDIKDKSGNIIIPKGSRIKVINYDDTDYIFTLTLQDLQTGRIASFTVFDSIILD